MEDTIFLDALKPASPTSDMLGYKLLNELAADAPILFIALLSHLVFIVPDKPPVPFAIIYQLLPL